MKKLNRLTRRLLGDIVLQIMHIMVMRGTGTGTMTLTSGDGWLAR